MLRYLLAFLLFAFSPICEGIQNAHPASLFPKNQDQIEELFQAAKKEAETSIQQILAIPPDQHTFENTILAYDQAASRFQTAGSLISAIKKLHPNSQLRHKAEEALMSWDEVNIDLLETNRAIYRLFQSQPLDFLNTERRYYMKTMLSHFRRCGFELDDQRFEAMKQLQKQIAHLCLQFQSNIAQDQSSILFNRDELKGLGDDFINSLTCVQGMYLLRCDYPTANQVLTNCSVESTRRDYWHTFHNRAYPQNLDVLKQLLSARQDFAEMLSFRNYAELDIASQMAKTPERVEFFLTEQLAKAYPKIQKEWQVIFQDLPESVTLTPEGQIKAWDAAFTCQRYFQKHFHIDQEKIAEYFPADRTIRSILDIYERFLGLEFQIVPSNDFWDPSVQLIDVRQGSEQIGYLILDLFPRPNKYSHACCSSIIPPTDGPALVAIITNFSKPTPGKPALLKHREIKTFLHELGHAIHALLGKAEMPTLAAYNTTMDFVEAPSQLLEEWCWNRAILKKISQHYLTGECLPDAFIDGLLKSRGFGDAAHQATSGNGDCAGTSAVYARLSLNLYQGSFKDPVEIEKEIYESTPQIVAYDPDMHFLCAFGHLSGYASKYYSYLWSKEIARKICLYMNLHGGLEDPAMGQRYLTKILGKGGSCDPEEMVAEFLIDFNSDTLTERI